MPTHQNWQTLGAAGMYGNDIVGRGSVQPVALSELDGVRMAMGRTPGASYPDGYLGTLRGRQDDKLFGAVQERTSDRPYQRGVHKGSLVGSQAYFWDPKFNPQSGLRRQAMKNPKRWAPPLEGEVVPTPHLQNDGKTDARSFYPAVSVDEARARLLADLMPAWRT